MSSAVFARFWQVDLTRECFLDFLSQDDLHAMRLVCRDFAADVAPRLFKNLKLIFNATSFSRQARMSALTRIGHHVTTFTFSMPHSEETFLPPLLSPASPEEVEFLYEPHVPNNASLPGPECKWWSWELNDLLVRQYPLLFHAATNVESFIRAMSAMPRLRHFRISCPGESTCQSARRNIVDYALISLRIAIEQSNLPSLETMSLDPIHPSAIYYLRPLMSIGSTPTSTRVYHRLKTLNINMTVPDQGDLDAAADSFKILHTYLETFKQLRHFTFQWLGPIKGPCPLSIDSEPSLTVPSRLGSVASVPADDSRSSTPSLSPASPRDSTSSFGSTTISDAFRQSPGHRSLRPLRLRHLKKMHVSNAVFDATQASTFIYRHRKTLTEFNFDSCHLRSGTWDDALEPLTMMSGNDHWKRPKHNLDNCKTQPLFGEVAPTRPKLNLQTSFDSKYSEVLAVPLFLSPEIELPDPLQETAPLELVPDALWQPGSISVFDEMDDGLSVGLTHSMRHELSAKRRGIMKLRNWGERLGFGTSRVYKGDGHQVAIEGVRRLLCDGHARW